MRCFAVTILLLTSFISKGKTVEIYEDPVTQRVVAGGSVTFQCRGDGEMGWYINDDYVWSSYREELENDGFDFDTYHQPTYSRLTMTAPATPSRNGTKIQCEAYSSSETALSEVAWLWIIGPPLTPNVSVELTSWNTMRLSWTAPFTADGFPILRYIVLSTNSSTGQRSRTDVNATNGNESLSIVDTPSNCHSLQFEILAQNSAGNSSSRLVSKGFPVAVEGFQVSVTLLLSYPDLTPLASISFYPPEVCSGNTGVSATYILELMTVSGVLVHRTETQYHDSNTIEETLTVDSCTFYYLNVSVFVPSFPELGTHTNVTEFNTAYTCPTADSSNAGASVYPSSVVKSDNDKTMTPTPKSSIALNDSMTMTPTPKSSIALDNKTMTPTPKSSIALDNKTMTPTPKLSIALGDKTMTPRTSRTLEIFDVESNRATVVGLSVAMIILLLIVLSGVFGVVAVLILRRRRITAERQSFSRPLPSMAPNPLYESATPIYDVIPDNNRCKLNNTSELELIPNDELTRYATTQSCASQRNQYDCGMMSDTVRDQLVKEDEEKSLESRDNEEDCYILMMQTK